MRSCGAIMRAGRRSSRRTTSPPSSARFRNRTRTTAMIRSTDRILTTHAGALPRSSELRQLVLARAEGQPHDGAALAVRLKSEVAEVVRKQIACGIDSVNDGELGKTNFTNYVRDRIDGIEMRDYRPGVDPAPLDISAREYRKYATLRVDAINHALRGIPREKVRLHVCWGSFHGPHRNDIPLEDIIDIIFRVCASSYSIEASNPVHEHEWRVFEEVKPPEGAVLIPGVVGHCCDFIEHPELVRQRPLRYAKLLGRENVMGGTDCGLGPRVRSPEIAWAKLEALAQGARLASKRLWIRPAKSSKKRAPARKKKAKR